MKCDQKCEALFKGKVRHVFCYITSACNANCVQCLYKPMKEFCLGNNKIDKNVMFDLLKKYKEFGAVEVTFLGGEPTLHPGLREFIKYSKELGYERICLETNGLFNYRLLDNESICLLDEIIFKLDDYVAEINDAIKGSNYYLNCMQNIKYAILKGYRVKISSCIHKSLLQEDQDGILRFEKMIDFLDKLGVETICFTPMLKVHIPCDTWSGNININVHEYFNAINKYLDKCKKRSVQVELPFVCVNAGEYVMYKQKYSECLVKSATEVRIFNDGIIRLCPLLIGSPYCIAFFDEYGIYYNKSLTNELLSQNMEEFTPCANLSKRNPFIPYMPVCVEKKVSLFEKQE